VRNFFESIAYSCWTLCWYHYIRLLSRMPHHLSTLGGLDPALVRKFESRSIWTVESLFEKTDQELVEMLDLPREELLALRMAVAQVVAPVPTTASVLHGERSAPWVYTALPLDLPALDAVLRGGLPCGSITELVGPAGLGKTQLCLQAAMLAAGNGLVIYLDTENKFSPARLKQMVDERGKEEEVSSRILVQKPASLAEILTAIETIKTTFTNRETTTTTTTTTVRLIILDSVAALARVEHGYASLPERQRLLGIQAAELKALAESLNIPVLVTNQVTTTMNQNKAELAAALGTQWAHAVNTRIILEHTVGHRWLRVAKSPMVPSVAVAYRITTRGVEELPGAKVVRVEEGDITQMAIEYEITHTLQSGALEMMEQ